MNTLPDARAVDRPGERPPPVRPRGWSHRFSGTGFGWRRTVLVRRALAGALVVTAALLAARSAAGSADTRPVLVTSRALAPGSTVHAADVEVRRWPAALIPDRALRAVADADGRVLAGAATSGEPLTATRLAGADLARASGHPDSVSVPIRLADAEVAGLLTPGALVDVVTVGERDGRASVLAQGATVLTVLPSEGKTAGGRGRLILVAVPRGLAARLAAATLSQDVTVTLR